MTITVTKKWESASGSGESRELRYVIEGTGGDAGLSDITARDAMLAAVAATYDGLYLDAKKARIDRINENIWLGVAQYNDRTSDAAGGTLVAFDTTGGTEHITHSLETIDSVNHTLGADAPDFKRAMNVNDNGVEGADIVAPKLQFSKTIQIATSAMNDAWVKALADQTATINDATWYGFGAKTVLLLGARGRQQGAGSVTADVEYLFAYSPKVEGLQFADEAGNFPDTIDKDGWDLLWVFFGRAESNGRTVRVPKAVYVERVYETSDFSLLPV